jgi:hypothetical protein
LVVDVARILQERDEHCQQFRRSFRGADPDRIHLAADSISETADRHDIATGQVGSDSSSDSWEDEEIPDEASEEQRVQMLAEADEHKLRKMRQAISKGLGITVEIWGDYAFEGQVHEVIFSKEFKGSKSQAHVLEPYQVAYKQIGQIGASFQDGLPASIIWTDSDTSGRH